MKAAIFIITAALFASPVLSQSNFTSVAAAVTGTPTLSTLLQAVNATSLTDTLANTTLVSTVFAPSDSAFQAYLTANNATLAGVLSSAQRSPTLQYLLRFHIVPGVAIRAANLTDGQVLPNLLDATLGPNGNPYGYSLTINKAGGNVTVRNSQTTPRATVTTADIAAGQSIVHIIDAVLIPTAPAPAPAPGSLPTLG